MPSNHPSEIFQQVVQEIKKCDKGAMYSAICKIAGDEKGKKICEKYGIGKENKKTDDIDCILDIFQSKPEKTATTSNQSSLPGMKEVRSKGEEWLAKIRGKILKAVEDNWFITVGAFAFVGNETALTSKDQKIAEQQQGLSPESKLPVKQQEDLSIALVIYYREVGDLKEGTVIERKQLEELIGKAIYFLCESDTKIKETEGKLDLHSPLPQKIDAKEYVYISVQFRGPSQVKQAKLPLTLKRNLKEVGEEERFTVNHVAKIGFPKGLEEFRGI